jgi:hypothetical protein
MKKIIFILVIFISSCTSDSPLTVPVTSNTSPMWRQFGYDARHTGNPNSPKVSIPPVINGAIEWVDTVTTGSPNDGTDCTIDSKGNIYFLSTVPNAGRVIKYNSTGQRIWEMDTLGNDAFFGVAISKDESKIYYSDFNRTTCRDSSGNLIWRIEGRGFGNPAIDNENNIYANNNGNICKISYDGVKLWTLEDVDTYFYSPALDRDNNIYIPGIKADHNVLIKLDKSGGVLWTYEFANYIPNSSRSVVIDAYGNIYYSHDKLYCIDKDGNLKWQNSSGGETTPALTKNNNLIAKSNSGFTMLDTAGNTIWSKSISINTNQSYITLDDNDNIYFNYTGLSVISLDILGNIRWNLQNITNGLVIPGPTLSPLARLVTFPKRPARVYCIK